MISIHTAHLPFCCEMKDNVAQVDCYQFTELNSHLHLKDLNIFEFKDYFLYLWIDENIETKILEQSNCIGSGLYAYNANRFNS